MLTSVSISNVKSEREERHLHVFFLYPKELFYDSLPISRISINQLTIPFYSSLFENVLNPSSFLKASFPGYMTQGWLYLFIIYLLILVLLALGFWWGDVCWGNWFFYRWFYWSLLSFTKSTILCDDTSFVGILLFCVHQGLWIFKFIFLPNLGNY